MPVVHSSNGWGNDAIHLSVVATSRNDNHGGSLTHRMQHFVDGFVAQCKRHGLRAELILVEWNPPPDRPPLIRELKWPADPRPCDIRIITVPPEVHRRFAHSDRLRLFQMIAKNAGIRRARGTFVLATNIDILFSDEAILFLRDRLRPGRVYLADRIDVPSEVPASDDFKVVLQFCAAHPLRINTGGMSLARRHGRWRYRDRFKIWAGTRSGYLLDLFENLLGHAAQAIVNPRWTFRRLVRQGLEAMPPNASTRRSVRRLAVVLPLGALRIARLTLSGIFQAILQLRVPFTNACGDFTAMSREDWLRLRGYAECALYSWHLDSLMIYQAVGCGVSARRLRPKACVFHIDHGEGFSPEQAAKLFSRLEEQGIPYLTDEDLKRFYSDIMEKRRSGQAVHFNRADWGLGDVALADVSPEVRA